MKYLIIIIALFITSCSDRMPGDFKLLLNGGHSIEWPAPYAIRACGCADYNYDANWVWINVGDEGSMFYIDKQDAEKLHYYKSTGYVAGPPMGKIYRLCTIEESMEAHEDYLKAKYGSK